MQKTLALLAGLLVAGIALGLYAYYGVARKDEAETARKEVQDHLIAAAPGEKSPDGGAPPVVFTRITVTAKGETTVLEKKPGAGWALTSPVVAGADPLAVDSLVSQLQTAKFKVQVEEAPDDAALTRYGLLPPRFTVVAEMSGDDPARKREVALLGGIENTFDGSVYLQRKGEKPVYSAEGGVRWALEKSSYELREKEVLALEEPKAKAIDVKSKAGGFTLERDAQKAWQMTRPIAMAADGPTVVSMLGALKGERALSFPADTPEARKQFGLDAPGTDATFTLASGEAVRLRVGAAGEKVYALREGPGPGSTLAEVSPGVALLFEKKPSDLKDKAVLAFQRDDVTGLSFFEPDGGQITVAKKPAPTDGGPSDEWEVLKPEPGPARKWKLSSVLWMLGAMRASAFGEENPKDWAKYGIGARSRQVALIGPGGKELARLSVGKEVEGKANTAYVRGSRAQVLEADTTRLSELPQAPADVLDKKAAPDAGAPAPR